MTCKIAVWFMEDSQVLVNRKLPLYKKVKSHAVNANVFLSDQHLYTYSGRAALHSYDLILLWDGWNNSLASKVEQYIWETQVVPNRFKKKEKRIV